MMAKLSKKVKVRKQSNSLMVVIPKIFAEALSITDTTNVNVTLDGDKLIVEAVKEND